MALLIANQDFSVEVGGVDFEVKRGDFWDSATALAVQVTGAGLFSVLPDGVVSHTIVGDWEG